MNIPFPKHWFLSLLSVSFPKAFKDTLYEIAYQLSSDTGRAGPCQRPGTEKSKKNEVLVPVYAPLSLYKNN